MAEMLVVKSKIKSVVSDVNVSKDFADALSEKVVELIKAAAKRSKANKRKTLKAYDV